VQDSSDDLTGGSPGNGGADLADDEAACWRHAKRLRREFPNWVVIWMASARQYRAYRISRSRRDSALTADTPEGLAARIRRAERSRAAATARIVGRSRR